MNNEKILNAVGKISDDLIEDAAIPFQAGKKRSPWKPVVALAACLCLLLTAAFSMGHFLSDRPPEVTDPTSPTTQENRNVLNYGQVNFLSLLHKTNAAISGQPFQHIEGTTILATRPQGDLAQLILSFQHGQIHVVARAVEELGTYETIHEYGNVFTSKYRLFRMQVMDPLESGMDGTFYYMLPADLSGDLTRYDRLLISMMQCPKNFVLHCGGALTAFEYLFCDPQHAPELGNLIAFTDGVFDASLWKAWWQDRNHRHYGYQHLEKQLEENTGRLLVSGGSTLEEALQKRQQQIQRLEEWAKPRQVRHYDFQTEPARQTMAWVKPFENGVFIPAQGSQNYRIRRYINGCPTNEWYKIDFEGEEVTASKYRFEDADFEKLPDISAYIANLDLEQIAPQHTDTDGKVLIYNTAVGWYEKTENAVYALVRIAWRHFDPGNSYLEYYDETFLLLNETGDHIISREELVALIGENPNISNGEYGVGIDMPMV